MAMEDGSEDGSWDGSWSSTDGSWSSYDDSWDYSYDDSWDYSYDDSWDSSWDESARLRQDDSWSSWDTSYDYSYDDSWDYSYDDSWSSYDDSWGSSSYDSSWDASEAGSGEAQGFHIFVGGAYDFEIGKFFISYCEGAYTGSASIWTLISSSTYWTNNYAPATGSTLMMSDCWMDPELVIELNDMLPPSIAKMLGEVEIYEAQLV